MTNGALSTKVLALIYTQYYTDRGNLIPCAKFFTNISHFIGKK